MRHLLVGSVESEVVLAKVSFRLFLCLGFSFALQRHLLTEQEETTLRDRPRSRAHAGWSHLGFRC
jgi:hypothetical protein